MTVTIYHNPKCSTSRATLALLRQRGIEPAIVEYLITPPSAQELRHVLRLLGRTARQLVRAKEARAAGVDPAALSEDALIEAMLAAPALIERPIVITDSAARIGRPPDAVIDILPRNVHIACN
jgi:arsenate reductase